MSKPELTIDDIERDRRRNEQAWRDGFSLVKLRASWEWERLPPRFSGFGRTEKTHQPITDALALCLQLDPGLNFTITNPYRFPWNNHAAASNDRRAWLARPSGPEPGHPEFDQGYYDQRLYQVECLSQCGRARCTASEPGFAEFCCSQCAKTRQHSADCNESHAYMVTLRIPPEAAA